eukprot:3441608-Alexandrium_andersonii.AAC.1
MDRRIGSRPAAGRLSPTSPRGRGRSPDRPDRRDAVEDATDGPGGAPVRDGAVDRRASHLQPGVCGERE